MVVEELKCLRLIFGYLRKGLLSEFDNRVNELFVHGVARGAGLPTAHRMVAPVVNEAWCAADVAGPTLGGGHIAVGFDQPSIVAHAEGEPEIPPRPHDEAGWLHSVGNVEQRALEDPGSLGLSEDDAWSKENLRWKNESPPRAFNTTTRAAHRQFFAIL